MLWHKYDPATKIYIDSVESSEQPENSVGGNLPEVTQHYTVAYIDDEWVSVIRPEYEVIDNKLSLKQESEVEQSEKTDADQDAEQE